MSRFSQFAYTPKEAATPMDIDQAPYSTLPEVRLHRQVMEALEEPKTNPQRTLKYYFERAFQKYVLQWISHQGLICNMHNNMSENGIVVYWINDALSSICPTCLKKMFYDEWESKVCVEYKYPVSIEAQHIASPDFPILTFLNKYEFRSKLESNVHHLPLPHAKFPPCKC